MAKTKTYKWWCDPKTRSRNFAFTINNWNQSHIEMLDEIKCTYLKYGKEVGKQGTPHLQGYIEFKNQRTVNAVAKKLGKNHVEAAYASAEHNNIYCEKEGTDIYTRGTPKEQGKRTDLEALGERILGGDSLEAIAQDAPGKYIVYGRGMVNLRNMTFKHRTTRPCVIWLYGGTGVGKTFMATRHKTFYIKDDSNWWDGYEQQEAIIIDDFDPKRWNFRTLLRLLDCYPFTGEVKGGTVKINSPYIYITCDTRPELCWQKPEHIMQVDRRIFKLIHLDENFDSEVLTQKWSSVILSFAIEDHLEKNVDLFDGEEIDSEV